VLTAPEEVSIKVSLTENPLWPEFLIVFETEIVNHLIKALLKGLVFS
jgi:hypothetical protein